MSVRRARDAQSECGDHRALHPSIQSLREFGDRQARDRPSPRQSVGPMYCAHQSGYRRTASVVVPRNRNDQENMSFYSRFSWRSSSLATPETVPVNSPVAAKKTGLLWASANTGCTVSANIRTPDASLKRPVPPMIKKVKVQWAS